MSETDAQEIFEPRMAQAMADAHESFWAEKKTVRFWFRMWIAMFVFQTSALIYDLTLPESQVLFLPFFCCYVLALIGGSFPKRRRQKHLDKMEEVAQELRDEHYRLVTGEDKR